MACHGPGLKLSVTMAPAAVTVTVRTRTRAEVTNLQLPACRSLAQVQVGHGYGYLGDSEAGHGDGHGVPTASHGGTVACHGPSQGGEPEQLASSCQRAANNLKPEDSQTPDAASRAESHRLARMQHLPKRASVH